MNPCPVWTISLHFIRQNFSPWDCRDNKEKIYADTNRPFLKLLGNGFEIDATFAISSVIIKTMLSIKGRGGDGERERGGGGWKKGERDLEVRYIALAHRQAWCFDDC